jgi:5-methylthioadenosine/S-adenosylhomocysteine deaminase
MLLIANTWGFPNCAATPLPNFGLLIDGNRILATGDSADLQRAFPAALVFDGSGHALLPGFVNAHDHGRGLGTASLGIADDILEAWLLQLFTQPAIPPYLAAALDGVRLIKSGVCATAHSHNPLDWSNIQAEARDSLRGYRDAGCRVAWHPPIVNQNPLVYGDGARFVRGLPGALHARGEAAIQPVPVTQSDYLALCEVLLAEAQDRNGHRVHIQVSPAGGQWCSDELTLACVAFARHHDTRVQMHMLETHRQRDYAYRTWGMSFIRHLDQISALGPWLTLAHMVWVDDDDLALLAERGVCVAHNPSSNLRLRSGIAPLARMAQAGVTIGIGLDGHGLDDDQDYLRELRLAHALANMLAEQPDRSHPNVPPEQMLRHATAHGARAIFGTGDGAPCGELRPGALADCVLIRLTGQTQPRARDVIQLASARHVRHVWVDGVQMLRDGVHVSLDENALLNEINSQIVQAGHDDPVTRELITRVKAYYADLA